MLRVCALRQPKVSQMLLVRFCCYGNCVVVTISHPCLNKCNFTFLLNATFPPTLVYNGIRTLCLLSAGETGLLVGKVTKRSPFVGYAGNQQQTEKKRLRDVLQKGDLYFNTGDLLRIDSDSFVYFQDRVGDTFR